MKNFTRLFFLLFPFSLHAQLYSDASNNLPDNGAKGPSMDVRAVDVDGDGDLDIVLANEFQPNTILLNDGNAVFTNGTVGSLPQPNHDSEDVAIADFNNDGHIDLVFCSEDDVNLGGNNVHEYYWGNGMGMFTNANIQLPDSEANAVIAADFNTDGFMDLIFGNNGTTGFLQNDGNGTFTSVNVASSIARTTQDLAIADVDGDGDNDLFEGNEDGNILWINIGSGQYADETAERLPQGLNIETRKVAFGDVDADGDVDIFLSNVEFITGKNRQNRLFLNDGNGFFTDATFDRLPIDFDHTIDAIFEDVDLDSDLDIVVCNVFGAPIKIYVNDGNGFFENMTSDILGQNYYRDALGVIAADFNGDGFRDIYICDRNNPNNNNKDLLLLREPITPVFEKGNIANSIIVYPNPAADFIFIKTNNTIKNPMQVFNISGKKIMGINAEYMADNVFKININKRNLASGLYFFKIGGIKKRVFINN